LLTYKRSGLKHRILLQDYQNSFKISFHSPVKYTNISNVASSVTSKHRPRDFQKQ